MIFYCVRHGESTHNAEGRLQGQSDAPGLSGLGRRQSQAAAEALRRWPIEAVYASPLRRAREMAEVIAETLVAPLHFDPRLKEVCMGVFQDKLRREVEAVYAKELAGWLAGDPNYRVPGGESRSELANRGVEALRDIARSGLGHAAIVSHGGLLIATVKTLLGIPLGNPPAALQNGSITRISWDGDGPAELLGLDEIDHLRPIGLAGIGDLAV